MRPTTDICGRCHESLHVVFIPFHTSPPFYSFDHSLSNPPAESYLHFVWWKFFSHSKLFLAVWGNSENQKKAGSVSFQQKSLIIKSVGFDAF